MREGWGAIKKELLLRVEINVRMFLLLGSLWGVIIRNRPACCCV